jgi:hypothetical protein
LHKSLSKFDLKPYIYQTKEHIAFAHYFVKKLKKTKSSQCAVEEIKRRQIRRSRQNSFRLLGNTSKRPDNSELNQAEQAEILLRCGSLAGYIGSCNQKKDAQESAKDLLFQTKQFICRSQTYLFWKDYYDKPLIIRV